MTAYLKPRLAAMMFLQYAIWGAWYVTLGTWLSGALHLTGQQIGVAAGTTAVGAIIAPFFIGFVADRWFATEHLLAGLHLAGACLLWVASSRTTFAGVYAALLLHCLCYMPTLALTNSLSFRHLRDPELDFAAIRVLGTIGWIAMGILVGTLRIEASNWTLRIGATLSVVMAVYCLTLPSTPPLSDQQAMATHRLLVQGALSLFRGRALVIFAVSTVLLCVPLQFYYAFTNLFLNQSGVEHAASKMTGGQISELFCMLLIPVFFRRLGVKYMLIAGMLAWALRYLLFAFGDAGAHVWMLWGGILLHGVCYDFFFVTGQIYIDQKASPQMRAAAQGLVSFLTYGVGMFLGSYLSGAVVQYFSSSQNGAEMYQWKPIWLICAAASAVVLVGFFILFPRKEHPANVDRTAVTPVV